MIQLKIKNFKVVSSSKIFQNKNLALNSVEWVESTFVEITDSSIKPKQSVIPLKLQPWNFLF